MIKLQTIMQPCFAMRFDDETSWVEAKPSNSEAERTALLSRWCARAAQTGHTITGIRLFIKKSYGAPVFVEDEKKEESK